MTKDLCNLMRLRELHNCKCSPFSFANVAIESQHFLSFTYHRIWWLLIWHLIIIIIQKTLAILLYDIITAAILSLVDCSSIRNNWIAAFFPVPQHLLCTHTHITHVRGKYWAQSRNKKKNSKNMALQWQRRKDVTRRPHWHNTPILSGHSSKKIQQHWVYVLIVLREN